MSISTSPTRKTDSPVSLEQRSSFDETIRVADRWYVLATSSRTDDRTRVLKHGDMFAVFDRFGDVHPIGTGELGIYFEGTRFLSYFDLRLNGRRPMLLNSSVKQDNSLLTVDLTTPDFRDEGTLSVLKGTVHVFRAILLWEGTCHQHLRIFNYNSHPVALELSLAFGADYADIFEVRGFVRHHRGTDLAALTQDDRVILGYDGLDGVRRRTVIACTPAPTLVAADRVAYALTLEPRGRTEIDIAISCEVGAARRASTGYAAASASAESAMRRAQARIPTIFTSNEQFNDWINRSGADLLMLSTDKPAGPYPYAGVPWYSTPFGRDGILTALQCLLLEPSMARGVLAFLAETQADVINVERDAEPGKILHEMRDGELAALGEIPFGRYYGSVDSTPLFVILAGAYYERTGDVAFVRSIWPNVERALVWIDKYGDVDGDGFIEYQRKSSTGLAHQGWKDSENAVFHRDGQPAEGPIALAEVQGYVYRAKVQAADLAGALGEHPRADALLHDARALRERFEQAFWCEDIATYALALDGEKRPCRVRSSNAGQVLWSGIASAERAERVAQTLFAPESFSGWGVRTIAEGESRYNPMSYHNGSIWPHDNALIGKGLARYGMKDRAMAILAAMFDASLYMDLHRLPELFCGFVRRTSEGPTLYPVACSPQAWASASAFYLLQACLGLSFHPERPRVRFNHPQLPEYLARVQIRNLRLGDAVVDLSLERHQRDVGVNVLNKAGEVEVSVVL